MTTIAIPSIADDATPGKATRREWIGLSVIALPCLLYSMDLTVLNLAVPHFSADLKPTAAQLLWIVDIYGFMVAGALITMGTLGDRIGRRRLLTIGAVCFGAASIFAAFSTTPEMLILTRALLGLAAATLAPSTLSLIRNMFHDPKERTFAIGVWIASFSAGGAIGPVVGGVLLTWFWWGSVFLIAVPVMILLLVLAPRLLPEFRDENAGSIDLPSAALSVLSVLPVIYGMKRAAESGFGLHAVVPVLVGLAIGAVFIRRQRRLADPMIDLDLFRSPGFAAALGVNVLGFFAAFGIFLLTAQYLQLVLGLSPLVAGLCSLPSAAAFIAGSLLTPRIAGFIRPSAIMAAGYVIAAAGFLMLSLADGGLALPMIVGGYFVLSIGLAPVFTLATDLIIGAAPAERAGTAASLAETSSEFGGALGIAVLGSVVTAIYRFQMQEIDVPGLSSETIGIARDTIGAALGEAMAVGGISGDLLATAAQLAYADAFRVAALVGAVMSLLAALAAGAMLRRFAAAME